MENTQALEEKIRLIFPAIYESELRKEIVLQGQLMNLQEGEKLIDIGNYIRYIPMVLEGSLKILREDEDGNELLMYYVTIGQTCAMSLTCCMNEEKSKVRAVAEENTTLIAIPIRKMDEWMEKFRSWKNFVMQSYQKRFEEMLLAIDNLAFSNMDERLEHYLIGKQKIHGGKVVHITHQEISQELNSSREVISRLLKQMEKDGRIKLGRNQIEMLRV